MTHDTWKTPDDGVTHTGYGTMLPLSADRPDPLPLPLSPEPTATATAAGVGREHPAHGSYRPSPQGRTRAELRYDPVEFETFAATVAAWDKDPGLPPAEYQRAVVYLTGAARAVADSLRAVARRLPGLDPTRTLVERLVSEADRRLHIPPHGTVECAQDRARLTLVLCGHLSALRQNFPEEAW